MRRLAAELFREVGVRPLENTREAAMVERFYCSRLYWEVILISDFCILLFVSSNMNCI